MKSGMNATLGGMRLPRLAGDPEAMEELRDGLIAAIDVLALNERSAGAADAPEAELTPDDDEIHAFSERVVGSILPEVAALLDKAIEDIAIGHGPLIADH
jgi:hypothetical protein